MQLRNEGTVDIDRSISTNAPGRELRHLGIGMLGYGAMGEAHSHALADIPMFFSPPPAVPRLIAIYGRTLENVKEAAARLGYKRFETDYRKVVSDAEVEIVDNVLPNHLHREPCIEAIEAGKHVICEKPLARNKAEAREMYEAARRADIKAMVAFNYRFAPAVQLAKELVRSGRLGRIFHFRAKFLENWSTDPNIPLVWRLRKECAGSGPLGDLGSHIVDLGRFLIGEVKSVTGITKTFVEERPLLEDPKRRGKVDVEDAFAATVEFENGAIGTLEASRFAVGGNYSSVGNLFEVDGEKGSIGFNRERMHELRVYLLEEQELKRVEGWRDVRVTDPAQPALDTFLRWEHTYLNELLHFLRVVAEDGAVGPLGATFEDGYRNAAILDAVLESASTGKRVELVF